MRQWLAVAALVSAAPVAAQEAAPSRSSTTGAAVVEKSIDELRAMLASGKWTSARLTRAYLDRIEAIDRRLRLYHQETEPLVEHYRAVLTTEDVLQSA